MAQTITVVAAISGSEVIITGTKTLEGVPADILISLCDGSSGAVLSSATVADAPDGAYSTTLPMPPQSATPYAIHANTGITLRLDEKATLHVPGPTVVDAGGADPASDLASESLEDVHISGKKHLGVVADLVVMVDGQTVDTLAAQPDGTWDEELQIVSGDHTLEVTSEATLAASAATTLLINPALTLAVTQSGTGIAASGTRNIGATAAPIYVYVYAPGSSYQGHGVATVANQGDGAWKVSGTFGGTLAAGTPWVVEVRTTVGAVTYSATATITLSSVPVAPPPTPPTGGTPQPPPAPVPVGPNPPPPAAAGVVAQFDVQNNTTAVLPARPLRFARTFAPGALPQGLLGAQVDVLMPHDDGSARHAMITLAVPELQPGTSYRAALAQGGLFGGDAVAVTAAPLVVDFTNVMVGTTPHDAIHLDLSAAIAAAAPEWMHGPLATQVRVDVPVVNALHVVADVTLYQGGDVEADVQFWNDITMGVAGGDITYDVAISYGGVVKFTRTALQHWQYQVWHAVVWSGDAPKHFVAHPPADLAATPSVHAYDLPTGYDQSLIGATTGKQFDVLGAGNFATYMGQTGGRPDIGPDPAWIAALLIGQQEAAFRYAVAMSDAAGSIPWHMRDVATGDFLDVTKRPTLWCDGRQPASQGGMTQPFPVSYSYTDATTKQVVKVPQSGWTLDAAHQPDAHYGVYLLTGDRYRHDLLVAQTAWDVMSMNSGHGYREGAQGIVVTQNTQTRAIAWNLRQLMEVAHISRKWAPLYLALLDNNLTYLLNQAATANQGEAAFWIRGQYGTPKQIASWQQDYAATSLARGHKMGFAKAGQVLTAMCGFLAGACLPPAGSSWKPENRITYNLETFTDTSFTALQTWDAIQAAGGPLSGAGAPPHPNWLALDGTPFPPNTFVPYYCAARSVLRYCAKAFPEEPRWEAARAWFEANTAFLQASDYRLQAQFSWAA